VTIFEHVIQELGWISEKNRDKNFFSHLSPRDPMLRVGPQSEFGGFRVLIEAAVGHSLGNPLATFDEINMTLYLNLFSVSPHG
jgi:hypothetical protein